MSRPAGGGSGWPAFSVQRYGMNQWGDLFTARQKCASGDVGTAASAVKWLETDRELLALAVPS